MTNSNPSSSSNPHVSRIYPYKETFSNIKRPRTAGRYYGLKSQAPNDGWRAGFRCLQKEPWQSEERLN